MTLNNDSAFYVQETQAGAIIDQFDTIEEALDAIKEYNETDKEEGTYTPDFYEVKHGTMLYDERGNAKKAHEITDRQRIGKRIAQLRNEAGMSQARLAELTGMEQPHIARIEAGRYSVGVDILGKIAAALGKRIDIVD